MRHKILSVLSVLIVLVAIGTVAQAGLGQKPDQPVSNEYKNTNVGHLMLFEKNPSGWTIVEDGAWGKLNYNLAGPEFNYVFNGHGLDAGKEYTLLYYPDPWNCNSGTCKEIATGVANNGGNLNLVGSTDIGTISDAKIWLVETDDLNADKNAFISWNPTEYLFENNLITYTDTS